MTTLKFEGEIKFGDSCRVAEDEPPGSVHVGDRDLIEEVEAATFSGPVTVGIADSTWTGDLFVETGWGYSEYTPVDSDALRVGPHDILTVLGNYAEGATVTVWISDEPIDLLATGDEA